jgi:hypothetical protein
VPTTRGWLPEGGEGGGGGVRGTLWQYCATITGTGGYFYFFI